MKVSQLYDCKKCGSKHGMGIQDVVNDTWEPIDICKDCLFAGTKYNLTDDEIRIRFDDLPSDPDDLQRQLGETLCRVLMNNYGSKE